MFSWRKWLESLGVNVAYAALLSLSVVFSDGAINMAELKIIGLAALGGFFMYLRNHPPAIVTDEMIQDQVGAVNKQATKLVDMERKQDAQEKV